MAEETKTPSLEDIAKGVGAYQGIRKTANNREQYLKDLNNLYSYLGAKGINPQDIPGYDSIGRDPIRFGELASRLEKEEMKGLVAQTESALGDILKTFNEPLMQSLAISLSGNKEYEFYATALQKRDAEAIKQAHTKKHEENPLLLLCCQGASAEDYLSYANFQLGIIQSEFTRKNLYTEVPQEVNGETKMVPKYDQAKAQEYLISAIGKLKNEEREETLVQIGTMAAQIFMKKKAEEAKKKKKD